MSKKLKSLKHSYDFSNVVKALKEAYAVKDAVIPPSCKTYTAHKAMMIDFKALINALQNYILKIKLTNPITKAEDLKMAVTLYDALESAMDVKIKDINSSHPNDDLLFNLVGLKAVIDASHALITAAAAELIAFISSTDGTCTLRTLFDKVNYHLQLIPNNVILSTAKNENGTELQKAYHLLYTAIIAADKKFKIFATAAADEPNEDIKEKNCKAIWKSFNSSFSKISDAKVGGSLPNFMSHRMSDIKAEANRL